jgi:hypothetical protein
MTVHKFIELEFRATDDCPKFIELTSGVVMTTDKLIGWAFGEMDDCAQINGVGIWSDG